jgi:hypothetical protein
MTRSIIALYDYIDTAQSVVNALIEKGISPQSISLIANDVEGHFKPYIDAASEELDESAVSNEEAGGVGAIVGGLMLAGLSAVVLPGVGAAIAAGPLVAGILASSATGAAAGGIAGQLTSIGVPDNDMHYYAEGVRRGAAMICVDVEEDRAREVYDMMTKFEPVDMERRVATWRGSGWGGFNDSLKPYAPDELQRLRQAMALVSTDPAPQSSGSHARIYGNPDTEKQIQEHPQTLSNV